MSTLAESNQINLGFVITNDKASYIAKEDSICLFLISKEAALNEQWIKPWNMEGFLEINYELVFQRKEGRIVS